MIIINSFVGGGSGVWTQGFVLARLYHFSYTSNTFCFGYLVIFETGSMFMHQLDGPQSYLCFLHSLDGRCVLPCPTFYWAFYWDGVSCTFCPDWPQTAILPISASWVVRISGLSHLAWNSLLGKFINLHFFRVNWWHCILFFWWCHVAHSHSLASILWKNWHLFQSSQTDFSRKSPVPVSPFGDLGQATRYG
jgi:hypothetical protein